MIIWWCECKLRLEFPSGRLSLVNGDGELGNFRVYESRPAGRDPLRLILVSVKDRKQMGRRLSGDIVVNEFDTGPRRAISSEKPYQEDRSLR